MITTWCGGHAHSLCFLSILTIKHFYKSHCSLWPLAICRSIRVNPLLLSLACLNHWNWQIHDKVKPVLPTYIRVADIQLLLPAVERGLGGLWPGPFGRLACLILTESSLLRTTHSRQHTDKNGTCHRTSFREQLLIETLLYINIIYIFIECKFRYQNKYLVCMNACKIKLLSLS